MSTDMKRTGSGSAESTAPQPKKSKPFRMSTLADVDVGSERNKICGTLVSITEPRGQFGLVIGILKLDDGHVKVRAFREHGVRLHNTLKDSVARHVIIRLVAAELEGEQYVDRNFGQLQQLIFNKPAEALVVDDDYLDPALLPSAAAATTEVDDQQHPVLMLKDVVKPGLYSGLLHVQLLDKVSFFASPAKEQASTALPPRFGTAVTDGDHKAEAYFLFNEAKFYVPGQEFNLLRFRSELVGRTLKLTIQQKYSVEKTVATLQSTKDEDDFDFPVAGQRDDAAKPVGMKEEEKSAGEDDGNDAKSSSDECGKSSNESDNNDGKSSSEGED
ncbi:hypothetical protein AAVH_24264 [Aphelenchoides avenae]|nr:hypothetical protein AAVH_24264 [Aphelenchus avenae]